MFCDNNLSTLMHRYSRRIMWLRVAQSNNDPRIIADYYLDCVEEVKGVYMT